MEDLDALRARRWWQTRRPVATRARAAAFLDDVGFALLFPQKGVPLPSLWEAASDREFGDLPEEWGPDIQRVWAWKDELPRLGLAWYGRFLRGRPSFLSPALLADLYPRAGRPDDFEGAALGPDASRVAQVLLRSGPTPTAVLREATGMQGKRGSARFSRAQTELGRALVITHFGVEEQDAGWPSAVVELTARAFRVGGRRSPESRRDAAARRFLHTMIAARRSELARAFGWSPAESTEALDGLVARGAAVREGPWYRAARGR